MIATQIYNGETPGQIGISEQQYNSRKETLDRYLATTGGAFDPKGYLEWLQADAAGDRGRNGVTTTTGIKSASAPRPCPSCGGGRIR